MSIARVTAVVVNRRVRMRPKTRAIPAVIAIQTLRPSNRPAGDAPRPLHGVADAERQDQRVEDARADGGDLRPRARPADLRRRADHAAPRVRLARDPGGHVAVLSLRRGGRRQPERAELVARLELRPTPGGTSSSAAGVVLFTPCTRSSRTRGSGCCLRRVRRSDRRLAVDRRISSCPRVDRVLPSRRSLS